jgi:peptidoglycan hydrolase-like protein with peptidoglycan-binding domain
MKLKKLYEKGFAHVVLIGLVVVLAGVIGTFMVVRSDAVTPCVRRTFGPGSKGTCVRDIQVALVSPGGAAVKANGQYRSKTAAAVKVFQRHRNLGADGVVGPNTWVAICKDLADAQQQRPYYNHAGCARL